MSLHEYLDKDRVLEITARDLSHERWLELYRLPTLYFEHTTMHTDDYGIWCDSCGTHFEIADDIIDKFQFCPYCGSQIVNTDKRRK